MVKLNPKFLYNDDGKKVAVVLNPKDFENLLEELDDYQDYKAVEAYQKRTAIKPERTYSHEEVMAEILGKK